MEKQCLETWRESKQTKGRRRFCLLDLIMKKTLIFDEKSSEARRFLVSCGHDWSRKVSLSLYIVICALIYLTCVSPDCSHSCFDCHEWQTSMLNVELINQPNPNRTNMIQAILGWSYLTSCYITLETSLFEKLQNRVQYLSNRRF